MKFFFAPFVVAVIFHLAAVSPDGGWTVVGWWFDGARALSLRTGMLQ